MFYFESGREDSNLRPSAPKADALAGLRYAPKSGHGIRLQATPRLLVALTRDVKYTSKSPPNAFLIT